MKLPRLTSLLLGLALAIAAPLFGQPKRKVIVDEDCLGPATTNLQTVLMFIQSPEVQTLGITVVSGDQWRDEEVAHALRLLEIIGRTDIPVVPGAAFPLIRTKEEVKRWEKLYGKVVYKGAWNENQGDPSQAAANRPRYHGPFEVPPLPEGNPTTKPADEDAARFIIRMLNQYPHEVTIYAGGPLTDLALAIAIDPRVPELAQELVIMGGAVNPGSADPEFSESPRREFNFWMDPEAARTVLRAPWPRITVTTVDISIKTRLRKAMIEEIGKARTPVAQYLARWADEQYMWDELAAAVWLDPSVVTKEELLYMSTNISHGPGYGETLVWSEGHQPGLGERLVHIPTDLDREKFYRMFIDLMTRPTPGAQSPQAIR